jgi:hypothetical protein
MEITGEIYALSCTNPMEERFDFQLYRRSGRLQRCPPRKLTACPLSVLVRNRTVASGSKLVDTISCHRYETKKGFFFDFRFSRRRV